MARDEATAALAMVGAQHRNILAKEQTRLALERGMSALVSDAALKPSMGKHIKARAITL